MYRARLPIPTVLLEEDVEHSRDWWFRKHGVPSHTSVTVLTLRDVENSKDWWFRKYKVVWRSSQFALDRWAQVKAAIYKRHAVVAKAINHTRKILRERVCTFRRQPNFPRRHHCHSSYCAAKLEGPIALADNYAKFKRKMTYWMGVIRPFSFVFELSRQNSKTDKKMSLLRKLPAGVSDVTSKPMTSVVAVSNVARFVMADYLSYHSPVGVDGKPSALTFFNTIIAADDIWRAGQMRRYTDTLGWAQPRLQRPIMKFLSLQYLCGGYDIDDEWKLPHADVLLVDHHV
jgi:hypothetical protein